jgi:multiple sugar transport system permease protein
MAGVALPKSQRDDAQRPGGFWPGKARLVRRVFRKPQFWFGALVLVPIFAWYAWLGFGPIIRALVMAVTKYKLMDPASSPFVGIDNFRTVFSYSVFWNSLRVTLTYAIVAFIVQIPLALFLSVCLNAVRRGQSLYRFIIFLPVVISFVAVALLFKMLMDPQIGLFNMGLRALGLPGSQFLSSTGTALASVIGVDIWKGTGFLVVILSAGMLNIPQELYDAGKVDGVTPWQEFWKLTLPLLGHTLALVCVLQLMSGLQAFGSAFLLTGGGPNFATYTLGILIYNTAFQEMRLSLATAAAFVMFVLVLGVTVIQLKLLRPRWDY